MVAPGERGQPRGPVDFALSQLRRRLDDVASDVLQRLGTIDVRHVEDRLIDAGLAELAEALDRLRRLEPALVVAVRRHPECAKRGLLDLVVGAPLAVAMLAEDAGEAAEV